MIGVQVLLSHSHPIQLQFFIEDATVVFVKVRPFIGLVEIGEGTRLDFWPDFIGCSAYGNGYEDVFEYNTKYKYKDMPILKDWLIKQNLML